MALFGRGKQAPPDDGDDASARLVVARIEAIADRYDAVYEQIMRALKPVSRVEDRQIRRGGE